MSSITQNIRNEAIKIFNKKAKNIFANNIFDLGELILSNGVYKTALIISKIKKIFLQIYKEAIEEIELMFFNSEYRRKNFYRRGLHDRTIIEHFGQLQYERGYYTDKDGNNGFYFIDELFNFEKYKTYGITLRGVLISQSIETNVNKTSSNYDLNLFNLEEYLLEHTTEKVPRQTIYNWIHEWDIPKVEYNYYDTNDKHLYVMVDEKWIHEQIRLSTLSEEEREKKHYIMSKCFVTFTGAKTKNGRKTLLNRHLFMTTEDQPWKKFMDEIYNVYNYENFEKIYLLSDAGGWILSGANELKLFANNEVILNTCEFHVKEYINRITHSKDKRKKIYNSIYEDKDKDKFTQLADEIIENAKNKDKKTQYKNYILNHWESILNMKEREVKSSMESHISHCVASTFGSRPKGYSKIRIEKYIKLVEYRNNNINILDLYLNSYNKHDEYVYKKNEVSYSIFEHNTSIVPAKSSNNPISVLLNNLAYNF